MVIRVVSIKESLIKNGLPQKWINLCWGVLASSESVESALIHIVSAPTNMVAHSDLVTPASDQSDYSIKKIKVTSGVCLGAIWTPLMERVWIASRKGGSRGLAIFIGKAWLCIVLYWSSLTQINWACINHVWSNWYLNEYVFTYHSSLKVMHIS